MKAFVCSDLTFFLCICGHHEFLLTFWSTTILKSLQTY